ncbi:hypothetical protein LINGRAHAP2_LOCUS23372 [Linum grandiflorum]
MSSRRSRSPSPVDRHSRRSPLHLHSVIDRSSIFPASPLPSIAISRRSGDALRGETVMEHESVQDELVRMSNDIQDELETLNGLTPIEKIQAALILVDSIPQLELFYRPKEDKRELFVKCFLGQF